MGHKSDDFAVYEGVPPGRSDYGHSFTLRVPDRQYPMSAETVEERDQWIEAIKEVISSPLSAQDAARKYKIFYSISNSFSLFFHFFVFYETFV